MKKGFTAAPTPPATVPAIFDVADLHAIHALVRGEASPDQQKRFRAWFDRASGVNENPFRPGVDAARETDFACGKKFVGDQFYAIAKAAPPQPQ